MDDEYPQEEAEETQNTDKVDDEPGDEESRVLLTEDGQDQADVDGDGHRVGADQSGKLPDAQVGCVMVDIPGLVRHTASEKKKESLRKTNGSLVV